MKIYICLLFALQLAVCRYLNSTDIDMSKFPETLSKIHTKNGGGESYSKATVRESLFLTIQKSLDLYTERVGFGVFGKRRDVENYSLKLAKDYVYSFGTNQFTKEGTFSC